MNFIPDDSYIRDFMLTRQDHFEASFEYPLDVVWQPPAFPAIKQLADLQTALEASNWVKPGSIESWYPAFCDAQTAAVAAAAAAGTATVANVCEDASTTASSFMAALNAWLSNPEGRQFRNHIVLSADGSSVLTTRMLAVHNPATVVTSENMVDAMFGLREDIAAAVPGAFPFTYQHMFWEQFAVVKEELYVNCSLALLCVMIICTILTAHPVRCPVLSVDGAPSSQRIGYNVPCHAVPCQCRAVLFCAVGSSAVVLWAVLLYSQQEGAFLCFGVPHWVEPSLGTTCIMSRSH